MVRQPSKDNRGVQIWASLIGHLLFCLTEVCGHVFFSISCAASFLKIYTSIHYKKQSRDTKHIVSIYFNTCKEIAPPVCTAGNTVYPIIVQELYRYGNLEALKHHILESFEIIPQVRCVKTKS